MAVFPRKPQAGDRAMQSMYDAICNIIDFLPSLEIRGDNRTIKIDSFAGGKTISAVAPASASAAGGSEQEIWPKLAKIKQPYNSYPGNSYYYADLIDANGVPIDPLSSNVVICIPGLSLGHTSIPIGTVLMVTPIEYELIEEGTYE